MFSGIHRQGLAAVAEGIFEAVLVLGWLLLNLDDRWCMGVLFCFCTRLEFFIVVMGIPAHLVIVIQTT